MKVVICFRKKNVIFLNDSKNEQSELNFIFLGRKALKTRRTNKTSVIM